MDTVSVVVIVIVGLLVVWGVFKALSNVRHDLPKKIKKEHFGGGGPRL